MPVQQMFVKLTLLSTDVALGLSDQHREIRTIDGDAQNGVDSRRREDGTGRHRYRRSIHSRRLGVRFDGQTIRLVVGRFRSTGAR